MGEGDYMSPKGECLKDTILKYSHNFVIKTYTPQMKKAVIRFARDNFIHTNVFRNSNGQIISDNSKIFADATDDRTEFRFHINCYDEFIRHINNLYIKDYNVIEVPLFTPRNVEIKIKDEFKPRDYQLPVIDYIIDNENKRFKLLALNTGEGKTISSFFALEKLQVRTVAIMKSGYILRWLDEINKVFEVVNPIVVSGSDNLKKLITYTMSQELDWDIALISNKTFQRYINTYKLMKEDMLKEGYDCLPEDFFKSMEAGFRLIDETHQDFHLNFKIDLYTHIERSLSLSATLVNRDTFLERMYQIAYPPELRYHTEKTKKFVQVKAVYYSIDPKYNIRYIRRGTNSYNHTVYEENIKRYKKVLKDYLEMINFYVRNDFIYTRDSKDKLIIFANSIEMCSTIVNYLKPIYKDLRIEKYTAEDDYENLIDSDIRVTTIGSGGTAHDIPNLTTIIMTIAIQSIQSNLQSFGRLREIKGKDLKFIYLIDQDNPKHMEYHQLRQKLFKERALSMQTIWYPQSLGS